VGAGGGDDVTAGDGEAGSAVGLAGIAVTVGRRDVAVVGGIVGVTVTGVRVAGSPAVAQPVSNTMLKSNQARANERVSECTSARTNEGPSSVMSFARSPEDRDGVVMAGKRAVNHSSI